VLEELCPKPVAHINSHTCGGAVSYTTTYRWFEGSHSLMVQAAESNEHIHFMSQAQEL